MRDRGVTVRVSREHVQMLEDIKKRFCYPTYASASRWLTQKVREAQLVERKEEPKKRFDFKI